MISFLSACLFLYTVYLGYSIVKKGHIERSKLPSKTRSPTDILIDKMIRYMTREYRKSNNNSKSSKKPGKFF